MKLTTVQREHLERFIAARQQHKLAQFTGTIPEWRLVHLGLLRLHSGLLSNGEHAAEVTEQGLRA